MRLPSILSMPDEVLNVLKVQIHQYDCCCGLGAACGGESCEFADMEIGEGLGRERKNKRVSRKKGDGAVS